MTQYPISLSIYAICNRAKLHLRTANCKRMQRSAGALIKLTARWPLNLRFIHNSFALGTTGTSSQFSMAELWLFLGKDTRARRVTDYAKCISVTDNTVFLDRLKGNYRLHRALPAYCRRVSVCGISLRIGRSFIQYRALPQYQLRPLICIFLFSKWAYETADSAINKIT